MVNEPGQFPKSWKPNLQALPAEGHPASEQQPGALLGLRTAESHHDTGKASYSLPSSDFHDITTDNNGQTGAAARCLVTSVTVSETLAAAVAHLSAALLNLLAHRAAKSNCDATTTRDATDIDTAFAQGDWLESIARV